MKPIILFLAVLIALNTNAQQANLDSLIGSKETTYIKGIVPAHATPGYEDIAYQLQSVISDAIEYYSVKHNGIDIHAKFAVLDSINWTTEVFPYGYMYGSVGWIVMPGDINFNDFIRIYGASSFESILLEESAKKGINPNEITESFFQFAAIHELGHLITSQLIKGGLHEILMSEMVANVVAYEFLITKNPDKLKGFKLFYDVVLKNYVPHFTTMNELYENYGKMGVDNYVWYHCSFMKLVEEIYNKKDKDFLMCIKKLCQSNNIMEMELTEIATHIDKDYDGIFTRWLSTFK
ncbi:MAG: hypothetical protein WC384_21020 [Prolixibacteraceae bacterium]|jgi:hypothetical protein